MSWDGFIDPIAGFFGQDAESQAQQGGLRTGIDGKYKPTLADQFWGRANDGQDALDTQKNTALREKYKPQMEARGLQWTDGLTAGAAEKMISDKDKSTQRSDAQQQAHDLYMMPSAVEERRIRDQRYFDNQKMLLQDRIDAREEKKQQFEYQKMRDRKEDMRYNEEMARLDAKDRRMAMQSLAAGLASLGAAFAM